jgi:hypothetical protein
LKSFKLPSINKSMAPEMPLIAAIDWATEKDDRMIEVWFDSDSIPQRNLAYRRSGGGNRGAIRQAIPVAIIESADEADSTREEKCHAKAGSSQKRKRPHDVLPKKRHADQPRPNEEFHIVPFPGGERKEKGQGKADQPSRNETQCLAIPADSPGHY